MDAPTSLPNPTIQPVESHSLPPLVLDLDCLATLKSPKPYDYFESALRPSTQSNLPKPRASLLIRNPSLPSLGMQTAIMWQREQLLATRRWMDERNCARCAARMTPVTQTMSQTIDTALDAMAPLLRYCRNVRPTWVKFNSKDTKESE